MSMLDDVIGLVAGVQEKLEETRTAVAAATEGAENALGTAQAVGLEGPAQGLAILRDRLEQLNAQLGGALSEAQDLATLAHQIKDGR